ncbi:hypothetical protein C8J57DRAFT_1437761 [Mycena rebaudengoi]|nr:hypothetical protein C8J57DRAFT_1437761 [Mycena rebaudengoi]
MKLYHSLPPEARDSFVAKKLAPLLDSMPKERVKKVVRSASLLQSRYADLPSLDFKGKKKEINGLLNEIARDTKRATIRERSNREELLEEIMDSILTWLNDIWTVVYEGKVFFREAHACLLFLAEVLSTLNSTPGIGGCKCVSSHVGATLAIKQKGKAIKTFSLAGPSTIDRVLLWVWRDLFLSMLSQGQTRGIPDMLEDIEEGLDWRALERILYGGSKSGSPAFDDDDDDLDDFVEDECSEEDASDNEDGWRCPCRFHAHHWTDEINEQRIPLRDLVLQHLTDIFELTPSHQIFSSILAISPDSGGTEAELLLSLSQIAGSSADTLVAALDIHSSEGNAAAIMDLLDQHAYLLRPRDAPVLQVAVGVLTDFPSFNARAVQLAETEMFDTIAAVRAAVRAAFSRVEDKTPVATFDEIIKLPARSPVRQQRVDAWVDSVTSPGAPPLHPMAFAAMMMGFPLAPGMEDGDDMDSMGFLDLAPRDPDLEDLQDEFRPRLRERFEGWVGVVQTMKGGYRLLMKVYAKVLEEMPYFKAPDVAEEMLNRLGERHSKVYILDAIDGVLAFCKTQRKKISAREKQRKAEAAKKASAGPTSAAAASTPTIPRPTGYPFSFPPPPPQSASSTVGPSPSFPAGVGGMEDVD